MSKLLKFCAVVVIIAIAASQLQLYYNIVIAGTYIQTATIFRLIMGVVAWPVAVIAIASWVSWKVITFKLNNV